MTGTPSPTIMTGLRIATFNLESLDDRAGLVPPLAERIAALRPQLLRLNADVLCLQEINAQPRSSHRPRRLAALDGLLAATPYAAYARATPASTGGEGLRDHHNLVLLSRFPVELSRTVLHELVPPLAYSSQTAQPRLDAPLVLSWDRPLLYAAIRLPGGQHLHVVNLHLKAPRAVPIPGQKLSPERWRTMGGWGEGFLLAAMKRAGQALEARLLIERLFDAEEAPFIAVAGDFNAERNETPVRIILGDHADGEIAGPDRRLVALEEAVPPERRYSVRHAGRPAMIDHLLVSPALARIAHGVEVFNEALGDEALGPAAALPPAGSYHAPLAAEFALEV